MAFCANCGAEAEGRFCPKCGAAVGAAAVPPPAASGGLTENMASALCYVLTFITGIVFLVLAPYNQNRTIRFHAFQSIFLGVAWFAWIIVSIPIRMMLGMMMLAIGPLVGIAFFILWIILIIKAYQGQKWVLPVIGPLAEKQAG